MIVPDLYRIVRPLGSFGLASDVSRPMLAVPVGNPRRCFVYSGHETGTDLDQRERELLVRIARSAGVAYAYLESEMLRERIAVLEARLASVPAG
jgi:hypothetical protein